jgi:hypothetical protein
MPTAAPHKKPVSKAKAPVPEPPRPVPVPTAVAATWFPAAVQLPDLPPLRLAKVFATPQGLYVYQRPPVDRHVNAESLGEPTFFSPINYDKTGKPSTGYVARNAGVPVHTNAGLVVITPLGGCGCGARTLKNWQPSWARRSISWEAAK